VNFSDDLVVAPRDDTRTMIPSSDPGDDPTARSPHSSFRSVLLFVSLSLHSLFEGLAIGIQPDLDTVLQVAVAVIIHKVRESIKPVAPYFKIKYFELFYQVCSISFLLFAGYHRVQCWSQADSI
jgi:Predicted divalent heavy-metal cations transporter